MTLSASDVEILSESSILGQLAHYLRISGRKYGFLSTHEETIFLKLEYSEDRQWILYVSNIFTYGNRSADPKTGKMLPPDLDSVPTNLSELTPKISTRLAMLTLVWLTCENMSNWL